MALSYVGLFCGAGGLDLGFSDAGFQHALSTDIDPWSVKTLRGNRPAWNVQEADIAEVSPRDLPDADVYLAGFPCQGFSLGGHRNGDDTRNFLYKEVVRLARANRPRFVVVENVLNLRTMRHPESGRPFIEEIARGFVSAGYEVKHHVFRVSEYGVPQTRRRFIFVASADAFPEGFSWPLPGRDTPAADYLRDIADEQAKELPNHSPEWGFASRVHTATGEPFDPSERPVPCRFSRTGSDGHPIRSLDAPFPAIDTATIWGWAQGNVVAERKPKDRVNGLFVRNPQSKVTLWRISASRLRSFTAREYARLQTFPDDWVFQGTTKRHLHKQIGNAVPVQFARRLAGFMAKLQASQTDGTPMSELDGAPGGQVELGV